MLNNLIFIKVCERISLYCIQYLKCIKRNRQGMAWPLNYCRSVACTTRHVHAATIGAASYWSRRSPLLQNILNDELTRVIDQLMLSCYTHLNANSTCIGFWNLNYALAMYMCFLNFLIMFVLQLSRLFWGNKRKIKRCKYHAHKSGTSCHYVFE